MKKKPDSNLQQLTDLHTQYAEAVQQGKLRDVYILSLKIAVLQGVLVPPPPITKPITDVTKFIPAKPGSRSSKGTPP